MIIPQVPVTVKYEQVLRYLGRINQPISGELSQIIRKMIINGTALLHPTAVVTEITPNEQSWPAKLLKCCTEASVIAVTVGETIDQEISRLSQAGETTAAVILDAVATTAVEEGADWVVRVLTEQHRGHGLLPTPRFGPGYGVMPMECLPGLYQRVGAAKIGITYSECWQMTPIKSLLFIVGWGTHKYDLQQKCRWCSKKDCQFRSI